MIIGKSTHPVYVKRISVRIWSLRDEIETALANRIQECEAAGIPVFIEDIKEFYQGSTIQPNDAEVTPIKAGVVPEPSLDDNLPPMDTVTTTPVEPTPPLEAAVPPIGDAVGAEAPAAIVENVTQEVMKGAGEKESKSQDQILKRPVERTIPNIEKLSFGFSLLSDVTMDAIHIFSKNQFTYGQNVIVEFLIPHKFSVSAEVLYCSSLSSNSRIISESKPDYRIKLKFLFTIPGERVKLRSFLKSIEPDLAPPAPKNAKKAGADSDVNLEDLDF